LKNLNIVVWGLGRHAIKNILPAIINCRGLKLYGVCSRNNETVLKTKLEYGCKGWTDYDQMLKDSEADVVYLSTPIALHYLQGKAVIEATKHLWCEKPLTQSVAEAEELVGLSSTMNVSIAECFMYLYHPQFIYLQKILTSGKLGTVKTINCRFGIPPLESPGFRNNIELGGSALLDVACYLTSAMIGLFPDATPEVLFSEISAEAGFSVDTSGKSLLRIEDADIILDWSKINSYRNEIDIWGTYGSISTNLIFSKPKDYIPHFHFKDIHGKESVEETSSSDHFMEMFKVFIEYISDKNKGEGEKKMILQRAALLEKIKKAAILKVK